MRYLQIFLLHFQEAFELRGRSVIYFLLSFINPLIILIYWIGVYQTQGKAVGTWELSSVASYYLLLIIASAMLISHIEDEVAIVEIQEGNLVRYLLKPVSYFWDHLLGELGWRMIQGFFGILAFIIFSVFLGSLISIASSPVLLLLAFVIMILGYIISFLFKMILGFTAFWLTDFRGLQQIAEVVILVFSGFIMPLEFYPQSLQTVIQFLPFPYSVYYPVVAIQGRLDSFDAIQVIGMQIIWIVIFAGIYRAMWKKGIHSFTGIGQ